MGSRRVGAENSSSGRGWQAIPTKQMQNRPEVQMLRAFGRRRGANVAELRGRPILKTPSVHYIKENTSFEDGLVEGEYREQQFRAGVRGRARGSSAEEPGSADASYVRAATRAGSAVCESDGSAGGRW